MVALAVGACWEIGEFASDSWLGSSAQAGNTDTMLDLIFDALGALGAGLLLCGIEAWRSKIQLRLLPARRRGA